MKTIAWDIDDVLNDLTRGWLESAWKRDHPQSNVEYRMLRANPPHEILGVTEAEYLQSLDAFRLSEAYENLEPRHEVRAWFERHGDRYRHVVVTAVPRLAVERSAAWVLRHFGRWVRVFAFVPSRRTGDAAVEYDKDKGEFLSWMGKADVLVDDSPAQVAAATRAGVASVLVPCPWNHGAGDLGIALETLTRMLA